MQLCYTLSAPGDCMSKYTKAPQEGWGIVMSKIIKWDQILDYVVTTSNIMKCIIYSVPMKSRIQPTVPSPPQASTLKSGTSLKKFSLQTRTVCSAHYLSVCSLSFNCILKDKLSSLKHFMRIYKFSSLW